jgi:hypothetical protein
MVADVIRLFALRGDRYAVIPRSEVLPAVDVGLISSLLSAPIQTAAIRELRARLRAGKRE